MNLGMTLGLRIEIKCRACYGTMSAHERACPVEGLAKFDEHLKRWSCPTCHREGYPVEADADDFLTCRKCRSRFTAGAAGDEPEVEPDRIALLPSDDTMDGVVFVRRFRKKAPRKVRFKSDIIRANFKASIRVCAAEKRHAKHGRKRGVT